LDPSAQLKALQNPQEWFVLDDRALEQHGAATPVVVRLNGCPLLQQPDLASEESAILKASLIAHRGLTGTPDVDPGSVIYLTHAVLLDEYGAMQQATSEVFQDRSTYSQEGQVERFGLPSGLSASTSSTRFWLVLGVQVNDSSVRLRLAAQLAAVDWLGKNGRDEPNRVGVLVSRRTEVLAHELLYWSGFDVVHDSCENWKAEIDHLVRHLEDSRRAERNATCMLYGV
jgi:hypothetical protein